MAVLREPNIDDNIQNYIASIGFFCVISCTVLMLRFLGFRASIDILNAKKTGKENENVDTTSVNGAFRFNRGEFFDSGDLQEPPRKILPAIKLPPASKPASTERPSKSTSDLSQVKNTPSNLQKSTPEISQDPGYINNNRHPVDAGKSNQKDVQKQKNEQLQLDKKRLDEQRKRDKIAAQEQAKQEKLRKEREKVEAQRRMKEAKLIEKENKAKGKNTDKGKVKASAPKPPANPLTQGSRAQGSGIQPQAHGSRAQPQAQGPDTQPQAHGSRTQPQAQGSHTQPQAQGPRAQPQGPPQAPRPPYSTNTLESSISKTSGPPPYTPQDKSTKAEPAVIRNEGDNTGNTSFAKPADTSGSSWDMIAQHREQINRQTFASGSRPKQTVLDLQFNAGGPSGSTSDDEKGNSEV